MKKRIFIALSALFLAGTFGFSPGVSAQTSFAELQAQIQSLLATIAQLQVQVAALGGQQIGVAPEAAWCHNFATNLRFGDRGSNVEALQTALQREGFDVGNEMLGPQFSGGYFGEATADAVVGFQQKHASEILTPLGLKFGTGFVGPSTRAKLNSLYGCGIARPTSSPPLAPAISSTTQSSAASSTSNIAPTVTILDPDVNNDGLVSSLDTDAISAVFLAKRGGAKYRQELDVNNSGLIDINDITLVSSMTGWAWPPTLKVGQKLLFYVVASDPNGEAVKLIASVMPLDATFDSSNGRFEWIPQYPRSSTIKFTASDARGAFGEKSLSVTVVANNGTNNGAANGSNGTSNGDTGAANGSNGTSNGDTGAANGSNGSSNGDTGATNENGASNGSNLNG